jgi:magnesium chelatase subunit D
VTAPDPWADALTAARLCAIDPGLGGMVLRGGDALRGRLVAELRGALPEGAPIRRIPAHIDDGRLLGGIDLTASLAAGRPVGTAGLLAEAHGGVVIVPMAERLSDALAGRLTSVTDAGSLRVEREGATLAAEARFVTIAFDDGVEPDERPPAALVERLAFWVDLADVRAPLLAEVGGEPALSDGLGRVAPLADDALRALTATAGALGVDSMRASLFAARAARAAAALAGRATVAQDDLALAARLVLAPRATRLPPDMTDAPAPEPPPPQDERDGEEESGDSDALADVVIAAALAALPPDVLAQIAAGRSRKASRASGGGERRRSGVRGRPLGARAGLPRGGARLSLIDTLRAAAPWQKARGGGDGRVRVRRDDLRVRRFETRAEAVTIFAVDASGSAALARLAEAKGAVELMLAEAYVKRAQVALVAFRGGAAELLLPPTRSLARARRALAALPGGGGTPLAAGLNAARDLAEAARARGRTPFVVVLTDGRANIAADGQASRGAAEADATAAAQAIAAAGLGAVFIDTSARPRAEGAALARAMRAQYLPLPRADAAAMHAAVRAAQRA